MLAYAAAYIIAAVAFIAGDAVWLTLAGPRLYKPVLGPLLSDKLNGGAAAAFYLMYLAGMVFLAIAPAFKSGAWRTAAINGLVLGVVAYGTYDLTNQATLKLWATKLTLADMAWGGVLTAAAATLSFLAVRALGLLK